jgi:hypothetical protein
MPIIKEIKDFSFTPSGPIFLLFDDADNLSCTQTQILNSWVSRRTTGFLSIKVAAQEGEYKTYTSTTGPSIEAPHDFSAYNIADKYISRKGNFKARLGQIVEKRLALVGINCTPEKFFPCNEAQELEIEKIAEKLKTDHSHSGKGARPSDDAVRYARPNYMKSLGGVSKSGSTYSYSGFGQLAHLSSGIIRHFLESASLMWAEAASTSGVESVSVIPANIQNKISRQCSDDFLFSYLKTIIEKESKSDGIVEVSDAVKLQNLVGALGAMFRVMLMDKTRSERRVFSIAFSNGPDGDVERVLKLGVKYGYFHRSTIGNKEGTGRVPLYILTRRLAPSFNLDPNGFAGYKFVQNDNIKKAMVEPNSLINQMRRHGFDETMGKEVQPGLFENA